MTDTSTTVRDFVIAALADMNFETDDVTDTTPLGEKGVELESLSIADLVMRLEEEFGVTYGDEDYETLPAMTFGAFVDDVVQRIGSAAA
ncbi:MAG TPA: phosphopantetheine-binding protein [Actinospica sp.]|jgi:acyl carrier protein|nr:phosphopantetheine-binding protein [Actinospica sp.]